MYWRRTQTTLTRGLPLFESQCKQRIPTWTPATSPTLETAYISWKKGNCEGHQREGDRSVILFGCIETVLKVKKFEEDVDFQWLTFARADQLHSDTANFKQTIWRKTINIKTQTASHTWMKGARSKESLGSSWMLSGTCQKVHITSSTSIHNMSCLPWLEW